MTLISLNRQNAHIATSYPERMVQFGGGNFLRAFVDWVVQELNEQTGFASSVVIVKPTSHGSYDPFNRQDGLFHVQLHGLQAGSLMTTRKLITCVSRAINPYSDFAAFITLARLPGIRFIVSNTTEAGLNFAPDDHLTNTPPDSFPAKLTVFLYCRWQHFQSSADKGCIVLPCELVERNGERLKQFVLQYANLWQLEPDFAHWLETSNYFFNTLVDRIVPGAPKENAGALLESLGFDDQLLVEAEQYHSWMIEAPPWLQDEFPVHQSNLNVKIVTDVAPYRETKVRILNGAHSAMTPLGLLLGLETVQQAVDHPALGQFVSELIYREIIPSFNASDESLKPFADDVLNRFRNPFIQHHLSSIALNSLSKFKVRLLPSLTAYAAREHRLPPCIVLAFAALFRFYKGEWHNVPLTLNDDPALVAWLQTQWQSGRGVPALAESVLANTTLWEQDLTAIDGLVDLISGYLTQIETEGIPAALAQIGHHLS